MSDRDDRLVRGTARRVGVQVGLLVTVTVLALAGLATAVVLHGQHTAADVLLRDAAARADDVTDPPAGVWLTLRQAGVDTSSPGLPAGLPDLAALAAVGRGGAATENDRHLGGREFRVLTVAHGGGAVQAALDLRAEHAERARLLAALLAGGGLGLALAVLSGTLLGRRAVRPLAEALALQRRFVADASHELRTPLTLLSTRAQLLQQAVSSGRVDEAARRDARGVVTDAQRLAEVVDDLLAAADPRTPAAPVDLDTLVAEVAASSTAYADARGVRLIVTPPLGGPLVVDGQRAALRRALVALVDNAVEHTPAGGTVTVAAGAAGPGQGCLTVADDGPGLDPRRRPEVLARFGSGGHGADRRHYGLGLALADEVAARHRGRLDFGPGADGHGTAFALTLPLAGRPRG